MNLENIKVAEYQMSKVYRTKKNRQIGELKTKSCSL